MKKEKYEYKQQAKIKLKNEFYGDEKYFKFWESSTSFCMLKFIITRILKDQSK